MNDLIGWDLLLHVARGKRDEAARHLRDKRLGLDVTRAAVAIYARHGCHHPCPDVAQLERDVAYYEREAARWDGAVRLAEGAAAEAAGDGVAAHGSQAAARSELPFGGRLRVPAEG